MSRSRCRRKRRAHCSPISRSRPADAQARTSLRQALSAIRKALPQPDVLLEADTENVRLDTARLHVDALELSRHALADEVQRLEEAANLYRGHLLDGLDVRAPAFEDWLRTERERLRQLAVEALSALIDLHLQQDGAAANAPFAAMRLLALDPVREDIHRAVMRIYAAQGRHAAALEQYHRCREVLRLELGVPPEPETEKVYRETHQYRHSTAQQGAPQPTGDGHDDSPVPRDPAPPASPDTGVRRHAGEERAAAPAELRHAIVFLTDIAGFTPLVATGDPEELHDYLLRYRDLVRSRVRQYGGIVTNHIGARVMAVFGVPIAHGNDPERAVLIRGDAGIGKSSLTEEFSAQARALGFAPHNGNALEFGGEAPVAQLLCSLLGAGLRADNAQIEQAVARAAAQGHVTPEASLYLAELAGLISSLAARQPLLLRGEIQGDHGETEKSVQAFGDALRTCELCHEAAERAMRLGELRAEALARLVLASSCFQAGRHEEARGAAERGLELSRRLGARRFESDALLVLGMLSRAAGDVAGARTLLDQAYAIVEETGPGYSGPWVLGTIALANDDPEIRRRALALGEQQLAAGCVSHNYFHFHENAIEVALAMQEWDEVERYAAALEHYTRREPLPWTGFVIARGRALARCGRGERGPGLKAELQSLRESAEQTCFRSAIAAVDAALADF